MDRNNYTLQDLYIGFSSLELGDEKIYLPRGMVLERTFAHVFSTTMAAFKRPIGNRHHPAPWAAVINTEDKGSDIIAQLYVPADAAKSQQEQSELIDTIAMLIRLSPDPAAYAQAMSNVPFAQIPTAQSSTYFIARLAGETPNIRLRMPDESRKIPLLKWVASNLETVVALRAKSHEFKFATIVYERSQYLRETSLALIQIWAALEALFLTSTSELRFRVSALIAAYLNPSGKQRLEQHKRCLSLYDKRSKAAHGPSKHEAEDLHESYEILRSVIFKIIREGKVPTKDELERYLLAS